MAWILLALSAVVGALVIVALRRGRIAGRPPYAPGPGLRGLTAAQAAVALPSIDLDGLEAAASRTFMRRAIRRNLITIFNVDMFALGALMFLLGSPLAGLGTMAVLIANVVIHVGQEMFARSRLNSITRAIQPRATVVRDGMPQQVQVREIVRGDLIAIGLGDEIQVSSVVAGSTGVQVGGLAEIGIGAGTLRQPGDRLAPGEYCLGGHALLRAEESGADREALRMTRTDVLSPTLTPLEVLVRRVLFVLLALVVIFSLILLTSRYIPVGTPDSEAAYRNALSIIFGVAPTSLFFLLVISYVMGLIDVALRGGLIYRPATIEALAAVGAVCISTRSVMSGAQVSLDPLEADGGEAPPPDLARRLLAQVMQSMPRYTAANQLIAAALPGTERRPAGTAGHLSAYGWQAASFDEPDMRGTFVVGVAAAVGPSLVRPRPQVADQAAARVDESKALVHRGLTGARELMARLRHRQARAEPDRAPSGPPVADPDRAGRTAMDDHTGERSATSGNVTRGDGLRSRITSRLRRALAPREAALWVDPSGVDGEQRSLLFAFRPDVVDLLDEHGNPVLPGRLIPLAVIRVSESVSAAARPSIGALQRAGMSVVLLSDAGPDSPSRLAGSLGVDGSISLDGLSSGRSAAILHEHAPPGELIAEVGHGLTEIPSMMAADIRIALRSASQAVLAVADVVVLDDSLASLPGILSAGRRIFNGIMAMLELNLSHIATQVGLIVVALVLVLGRFPYSPVQSGVISAFAITVPSVLLLLLAPSRRPGARTAAARLARFVLPSGVATVALAMGVFLGFEAAGRSPESAQLATTWVLVASGLVRVFLALPPARFLAGGEPYVGDLRVLGLAAFSGALFIVANAIPITRGALQLGWLPAPSDYLVLANALLFWVIAQLAFWRWAWREPAPARPPVTAAAPPRAATVGSLS